MSTVKFRTVIRQEKLSHSTREAPVCLRITKDRKSTYKTLFHIRPQCWDAKEQCVVNHPNAEILNAIIAQKRAEAEKETCLMILSGESFDISSIRRRIRNKDSLDFFDYADRYCESIRQERYNTYLRIRSIIRKVREFHRSDRLPVGHITKDFLKGFEHYLDDDVGNCRNSIATSMKYFGKLVGNIYRENGLNESSNPFQKTHFRFEPSQRQHLDAEEVATIRDLELKPGSSIAKAREVFIFECFTGLRISDILTLKWSNIQEDAISLRMRKTDKQITVPLQKDIRELLKRRKEAALKKRIENIRESYVFDYIRLLPEQTESQRLASAISASTSQINKQLKTIAKLAKIDKSISTHVGRHSFATMLLTGGIDLPVISELMGHHDIKVTQIYAKVVSSRKAEAINTLNRL